MATPFLRHTYVNGDVPSTATLIETDAPSMTVFGDGWVLIVGATTEELIVREAPLLVAEPALLETTTL
jgi:hypothetical protein